MEKKFITEAVVEAEGWDNQAREVKLETLIPFLNHLLNGYSHDQNTIVHAMVAGCLATISAMNAHPEGDIGESQAHKLLSLFIRKWTRTEGPLKLMSWAGLLHPGNEKAMMVIPKEVAALLVRSAEQTLAAGNIDAEHKEHLEKIVAGQWPWGFRG